MDTTQVCRGEPGVPELEHQKTMTCTAFEYSPRVQTSKTLGTNTNILKI
jgi:hypothetical protein